VIQKFLQKELRQRTTKDADNKDVNSDNDDIDDDKDDIEVILMQVSLIVDQIPEDMRLDSLTCFYRNAFYPLFKK
jgi:hypothetical protein